MRKTFAVLEAAPCWASALLADMSPGRAGTSVEGTFFSCARMRLLSSRTPANHEDNLVSKILAVSRGRRGHPDPCDHRKAKGQDEPRYSFDRVIRLEDVSVQHPAIRQYRETRWNNGSVWRTGSLMMYRAKVDQPCAPVSWRIRLGGVPC